MAWSQAGDRPGHRHQAPYKARACSSVGTRAGRTGLSLFFFPSGTGFPVGLTVESLGSGVQDVPAGLDLGQQGSPLASPAKANTGNARDLSVRTPHLLWLARSSHFLKLSCRQAWHLCSGTAPPGPVPQENTGKQSGDQQAAKGVRRSPGWRPPCCCQDPVSRPCTAF